MISSGLGGLGGLLVLVGFGLMLVCIIWNPFSMTALALIPGLPSPWAASRSWRPAPAPAGPAPAATCGRGSAASAGCSSTPSSKERFDFSGRKELYTAYVPWAVALDCADEWAAKYRVEVGEEPPVPHYFAGAYAGANVGAFVCSMVGDFDSTVERRDLVVQRHPELVLERGRGRGLLRWRRRRRRWWRVVVTVPDLTHPSY